jgi:hypothetical protein
MRIRLFRAQKEPGLRLSVADLGMAALAVAAWRLLASHPELAAVAPLPLHLVLTFLCFCNIFRIGTIAEICWAGVLVVSWAAGAALGMPPYPFLLWTTIPAASAAVVGSALWGKYNGIGHSLVRRRRCSPA